MNLDFIRPAVICAVALAVLGGSRGHTQTVAGSGPVDKQEENAKLLLAAQKPSADPAAVQIDELRQAFNRAYSAGNATAIASLLAEDAVWMPPGEPTLVGRSAIENRYAAQFATIHSSFALAPGEIRVVADVAWLRGSYQRVDSLAGGPPVVKTGTHLMTFCRRQGEWKIVNDCWNPDDTSRQVDARIALAGIQSLAEWRLRAVARMLKVIADTDAVKSGTWEKMTGTLQDLADTGILANSIWFVKTNGFYYSVELGNTGLNLSDRSYFPGLMGGQSVLGTLVISKSSGKRSVIIAEPVRTANQVIGAVGVSYSVDQLSLEVDQAIHLPSAAIFYALDVKGQAALHRDPTLMFEYPSDMGSQTLAAAVTRMLSEPSGTVEYMYRDVHKTVLFQRSSMLGWVFALGFSGPVTPALN